MITQSSHSTPRASTVPQATLADRSAFWSAVFAAVAAIIGIVSAVVSWRGARVSANVSRRQMLFSLDEKWTGVNELNAAALIGPDVRSAINALELTASCWHHDSVEKAMIIQLYWKQFAALYDTIATCDAPVPGYGSRECRSFLGPEVRKAYLAMREASQKGVSLTSKI